MFSSRDTRYALLSIIFKLELILFTLLPRFPIPWYLSSSCASRRMVRSPQKKPSLPPATTWWRTWVFWAGSLRRNTNFVRWSTPGLSSRTARTVVALCKPFERNVMKRIWRLGSCMEGVFRPSNSPSLVDPLAAVFVSLFFPFWLYVSERGVLYCHRIIEWLLWESWVRRLKFPTQWIWHNWGFRPTLFSILQLAST